MTSQIHTQNQHTKKETQDLSNTPVEGMFKARPFVVQVQKANQVQQPDLKTSLIQAKRYGHHLNQIDSASVSKPEVLQPKMETGKPVQLSKKKKDRPTGTTLPATGRINFSNLKITKRNRKPERPPKPKIMQGIDERNEPLTAHHKYGFERLKNDVIEGSTSPQVNQNISDWADPKNEKSNLSRQDVAWSPPNIMMGPLSEYRADDPAKLDKNHPDLDTHFTASGSVTPNSHVVLEIVQGGGLPNFNHADLVKKLNKLENLSQPSLYNKNEWGISAEKAVLQYLAC